MNARLETEELSHSANCGLTYAHSSRTVLLLAKNPSGMLDMNRIIFTLIAMHLLAHSAFALPCAGDTFVIVKGGKVVETFNKPDFWPILNNCSISYQGSPPASYELAGEIVSDNTGYGAEQVSLLFGSSLHEARSAVDTDVQGRFKIRILIDSKAIEKSLTASSPLDGMFLIGPGERYKHFRNGEAYRSYTVESLKACCQISK